MIQNINMNIRCIIKFSKVLRQLNNRSQSKCIADHLLIIINNSENGYWKYSFKALYILTLLQLSMKRIHTSIGNTTLQMQLKEKVGILSSRKNKRCSTEQSSTLKPNLDWTLAQVLKQNRSTPQKSGKRRSVKGLLDLSLKEFKKERLTSPAYPICVKAGTNLMTSSYKSSLRSDRMVQLPPQKTGVDMDQIEEIKNEILKNLKKDMNTPVQKQEKPQKQQTTQQILPLPLACSPNIHVDCFQDEIVKIKEFIKLKIDSTNQVLQKISALMARHRVHFKTTLFLLYKVFWIRRMEETERINTLYEINGEEYHVESQLTRQNLNIEACLDVMLNKLKQSKKWDEYDQKRLLQQKNLGEADKQQLARLLLDNGVKDYCKLKNSMDQSVENRTQLYRFGCCLAILVNKFLNSALQKQFAKYQNESQPQGELEELSNLLSTAASAIIK